MTTQTIPDLSERIGLSNALADHAETFALEAALWRNVEDAAGSALLPHVQAEARTTAVNTNYAASLLALHSRQILGGGDIDIATAYVEAADLQLEQLHAARRLLETVVR